MNQVLVYYWRGRGPVGALVRHSSASPWDHCAIGIEVFGIPCYFEASPGAGFQLVPISGDERPQGVQRTGKAWDDTIAAKVMETMSRRPYSYLNGFLTAFGIYRKSEAIQCGQACKEILDYFGIPFPEDFNPEPGQLAIAVERATGNPVSLLL